MADGNKRYVFISHSSADRKFVRALASQLKALKIPIWLDEENLTLGSDWRTEISNAIRDAYVIIVVLSENSLRSPWQNVEIGIWLSLMDQLPHGAQRLLPIRITRDDQRPPELPAFLRSSKLLESDTLNVSEVADAVADAMKG